MIKRINMLKRTPIIAALIFALLTINVIVLIWMLNSTLGEPMIKMEVHMMRMERSMARIADTMGSVDTHMQTIAADITSIDSRMSGLNATLGIMNTKMDTMHDGALVPMQVSIANLDKNMASVARDMRIVGPAMHDVRKQMPVMTQAAGQAGQMMRPMTSMMSMFGM